MQPLKRLWRWKLPIAIPLAFLIFAFAPLRWSSNPAEDDSGSGVMGVVAPALVVLVLIIGFGWMAWISLRLHSRRGSLLFYWILGLMIWLALPHVITEVVDTGDVARRSWWTTVWYWTLRPLPFDIAELLAWTPAVDPIGGWRAIPILGAQALTVIVVLGGLALIIQAVRASSRPANHES